MVTNKRDRWFFTLRLTACASFSLLFVVRKGMLAAEKFECDPKTSTPKFFVDDFDCRSFFRCVPTAAAAADDDDATARLQQTVVRFKCRDGFVFDPCRLKCLWSEECLPSKIGQCDGELIRKDALPPPQPFTSSTSVDDDVESSKINTTTFSTGSSFFEGTSEKSSPFAEKNYSNISVDDVAPGVTVVPNETLTTYYVVRVIFKGNFSLGSSGDLPTLELANDTTSFVEFIGSTTPSVAAADGGSNETSNDTSSTLVSRTALAIWNDTLDERLTDAASDVIVRNSSQEPTWTSVVGLTIPESTGDGTNMATDEAFNSTMKTIIVDCDRGNSKICDNFYSRQVISRRNDNDDDFVGRKIATSDDDDEDRENLVEMVHPCLDNVACENGGMFLSMSDGRCGCLCPTGYRGPLCQRLISRFQCGCQNGGECVRVVEKRATSFGPETNESSTVENSPADEPPENQVSYVCSCPPGVIGPKCQFVLPSESAVVLRRSAKIRHKSVPTKNLDTKFRECKCQNGGTCLVKRIGYVCLCPEHFTGRRCEIRDERKKISAK